MTRWNAIFKKMLHPKLWSVLLEIPIAVAGLNFFMKESQSTWIAYPIYIFSAYILTVS